MCLPLLAAIPAAIGSIGSAIGGAVSSIGIGGALSAAGTVASAAGSIMAGQQQKAAADQQAKLLDRQAVLTTEQGNYEQARKQDEINKITGTQIAGIAGSGVNFDGSPTDVITSSASQGALDMGAIRYGSQINASNLSYQASLARQSGQAASTAGFIGAAGGLLGGLGNLGVKLGQPYGARA